MSLEISLPAWVSSPAATGSDLASPISASAAFCSVISLRKLSVSNLGSASSSPVISSSISVISLSVKPASFRFCLCSSVSVKTSFSTTAASLFSVVVPSAGASLSGVSSGDSSFNSSAGVSSAGVSVSLFSSTGFSSLVVSVSAVSSATAWFSLSSSAASTEDGDTRRA